MNCNFYMMYVKMKKNKSQDNMVTIPFASMEIAVTVQDPVCLIEPPSIIEEEPTKVVVSQPANVVVSQPATIPVHPAPVTISFTGKSPITLHVMKSGISPHLYSPALFEIEQKEPYARLILFVHEKCQTQYVSFYCKNQATEQDPILRDVHTLSKVVCFSTDPDVSHLTDDTPLLWCIFEYSDDKMFCLVDGFLLSRNEFNQKATEYEKDHEKKIFLDIDRTIGVTYEDCPDAEKYLFKTDINIEGHMYVSTDYFRHRFMIRDGLYDCIRFLQEHGITIYFITWGDLNYGRDIIKKLNQANWKKATEPRSETDVKVVVPTSHVFSRRNTVKKALPKHFATMVPFYTSEQKKKCMGIDDDTGAWNVEVRDRVYAISRFSPLNNYRSDLLSAVYEIVTHGYL